MLEQVAKFGDGLELDPAAYELRRSGRPLKLERIPMETLLLLVERKGQLVSREDIIERIWGKDVFLDTDTSINSAIRKIRQVLKDDPENPVFIQTVTGKGYRFIAALTAPEDSPVVAPLSSSPAQPFSPAHVDSLRSEAFAPSNGAEALWREKSPPVSMGLTPGSDSRGLSRRTFVWRAGVWGAGAATAAAGGLWLMNALRRKPRAGAIYVSVPMPQGVGANDPGRVLGPPVVSPDGSALVVSLKTSTGTQLYTRPLNANQLIPMERTQGGARPFWSPDSQHIAFFADGKLKRVPAAGGSVIVLCETAESPRGGSWGTRGKIIFAVNHHAIFQVAESGGPVTAVNQLDTAAGENSHRIPAFLPDGNKFIYFARNDNPDRQAIYLESMDRSVPRKKISVAEAEFTLGRDPDTQNYFLLTEQAGKIVAQHFDVRSGDLDGQPHRLVNHGGMLSASNTGALVMRTEQLLPGLVWRDRSGKKVGVLGEATEFWSVTLSPNGRLVAAAKHDPVSGQFTVLVASVTDGLFEPVSDANHAQPVLWSSDSNTICYADFRESRLYRRTLSPRGVEEVVGKFPSDAGQVEVSPDGRYAAAELAAGSAHTEMAWIGFPSDAKGDFKFNGWHKLGSSDSNSPPPRFSPDGKWLAFSSNQSGTAEVYVMDFPAGLQQHRVSKDGGRDPCWRKDGEELFYVSDDGSLMAVPISSRGELQVGKPDRLFAANLRVGSDGTLYDVSPDGQRFLMIDAGDASGDSSIEMILNWPSLLQ